MFPCHQFRVCGHFGCRINSYFGYLAALFVLIPFVILKCRSYICPLNSIVVNFPRSSAPLGINILKRNYNYTVVSHSIVVLTAFSVLQMFCRSASGEKYRP